MRELFPGDVIQIKPAENMVRTDIEPAAKCFQGCLAIVDEVKKWGVVADIWVPLVGEGKDTPPGVFPVRLESGTFTYIGIAVYPMGTRDDV